MKIFTTKLRADCTQYYLVSTILVKLEPLCVRKPDKSHVNRSHMSVSICECHLAGDND